MDRRSVLKSLAALAVAPLDALVPAKPKTHGIVFDGVDDMIDLRSGDEIGGYGLIPTGVPVEISRDCRGRMIWLAATLRGYKLWDGETLIVVDAPL